MRYHVIFNETCFDHDYVEADSAKEVLDEAERLFADRAYEFREVEGHSILIDLRQAWSAQFRFQSEKEEADYKALLETAHERWKLKWMMEHNFTLPDLAGELNLVLNESEKGTSVTSLLSEWEYEKGFGRSIWPCIMEFENNEFKDPDTMKQILSRDEFITYVDFALGAHNNGNCGNEDLSAAVLEKEGDKT